MGSLAGDKMKHLLLSLTFAVTSFGALIHSDNFDASLPATTLNADIPDWDELDGTVDYLKNGFQSIGCRNGSSGCIDLDGSTGDAADLRSSALFNLTAGNIYTLTYWFSGSQRSGLDSMTVSFGGQTNTHVNIAASTPYTQFSIVVTPLSNTTSRILFSHSGGDNVGLVLDDVSLDESPAGVVPEPSSMILFSSGLALVWAFRKRM
jgi:hypothetical protein